MPSARSRPTASSILLDVLDCAFERRSWHGATLTGAGVAARKALCASPRRKSLWEQLLHAAYCKHRVLTRLAGPARFPPTRQQLAEAA